MNETGGSESTSAVTFRNFLENVPPGSKSEISDLVLVTPSQRLLNKPQILIHCVTPGCEGLRYFRSRGDQGASVQSGSVYLHYSCNNCGIGTKVFAIKFNTREMTVEKYGERPEFGPPVPTKVNSLLGADRDIFFKGRRCELQGLGIGAFSYYRRVIESQKGRLFDEIIRVLEKISPGDEVIEDLRIAKRENQFSKSIEAIKHALPASILVNGENPLRMLHRALSDGVHNMSDAECLSHATAVRTVLFAFSERLAQALQEDAGLTSAVALLTKKSSPAAGS